jgi:hypothetical protein
MVREQFRLVKSPLAQARAMKRNGQCHRSLESLFLHVVAKLPSQRPGQRNATGVFEMVQDASHRVRKQKQRAGEVEGVVPAPAGAAKSFNDRSRHAALWAEGMWNRLELCPAVRTRDGPATLKNPGIAENTRLRKNKVQDRVDHNDLSSTQRATLLYFE